MEPASSGRERRETVKNNLQEPWVCLCSRNVPVKESQGIQGGLCFLWSRGWPWTGRGQKKADCVCSSWLMGSDSGATSEDKYWNPA